MRAKTSDFKSLFPVFIFRKTVLTDFRRSHGLEKDDKLSKISSGGTNHNLLMMIFAGIAFLKKWSQLLQASIHALPFHLLQKKGDCLVFND